MQREPMTEQHCEKCDTPLLGGIDRQYCPRCETIEGKIAKREIEQANLHGVQPGEAKKQSMLYEVCPHCGGNGGKIVGEGETGGIRQRVLPCCKMLGVV